MSVKISGSIAFDTIMVFQGRFREHILPDQVHMLNVAFLAPEMRQEYGGCAANIAYTLKGLGQDCSLLGAIGRDGAQYLERLRGLGIETSQVLTAEDCFSAQAFITTDLDDNQITAFHPGAMNRAGEVGIGQSHATIGIVSPNGKDAMIRHAKEFSAQKIPFIFDPGQAMPIFDATDLVQLVGQATWIAVNDYEGHMLAEKLGWTLTELCQKGDLDCCERLRRAYACREIGLDLNRTMSKDSWWSHRDAWCGGGRYHGTFTNHACRRG